MTNRHLIPFASAGIYNNSFLLGLPSFTQVNIGGNNNNKANYFTNCFNAVYALNRSQYNIQNNTISNGANGINISNTSLVSSNYNCIIRNNTLVDMRNTGFKFNMNNAINVLLTDNSISYSSPAQTTFTSRAVEINEFSSVNSNPKYYVWDNDFYDVFEGIKLFNTNTTTLQDNYIRLNPDPNTPFSFNTGIQLVNGYSNIVSKNTIDGVYNPSIWWQSGMVISDSPLSSVYCNTINNPFTGMIFQGQTQSDVYRNKIYNADYAIWAQYNCVIGPQDEPVLSANGYPGQPADNEFYNIAQWHSYFSNGSNGGLSQFFVRQPAPFDMTLNGFASGGSVMTPIVVNTPIPFIDFCSGNGANRLAKQAIPIAQDILFPTSETRARFISKQKLYDNLQLENINTTSNSSLDNFKNTSALNNVGAFYSIDKNMADAITQNDVTLRQAAQTANNSLVPSDNMEALQKQLNGIYLNYLNNNNSFAGNDFATLQQIAALCPFTDGSSIWQARALIAIYDSTVYQNVCEQLQDPANSGARLINAINDQDLPETVEIGIFPNPNNGTFSIIANGKLKELSVEIYSLLGNKVLDKSYNLTDNKEVKIENISEGVYMVKLLGDGKLLSTKRVVVTK